MNWHHNTQVLALLIFSIQIIFALKHYLSGPSTVSGETKSIWTMELPIRISVCKIDQFDMNNKIGFSSQSNYYRGKSTNKTYFNWMGLEGRLSANETIHQLFLSWVELIKTGIKPVINGTTTTVLPIGLCKHFEAIPDNLKGRMVYINGLKVCCLSI